MTRVLIVEDEPDLADPLAYLLQREGFDVEIAEDGPAALDAFATRGADIVLLDLMLPGMPGTEVCRVIRTTAKTPIIMLTAKDSEVDIVVGLELGADDYVTKPYSSRELLARMRAVLRRTAAQEVDVDERVVDGGRVVIDVDRHTVAVDGETIPMPLKEFELLEVLLRNLVDNALRYSPEGGRVVVSLDATARSLQVADDGPGIPPAERAQMLTRFARGSAVEAEGCGLGLSIVGRIAEITGATLAFEDGLSRADGGAGLAVVVRFAPETTG